MSFENFEYESFFEQVIQRIGEYWSIASNDLSLLHSINLG